MNIFTLDSNLELCAKYHNNSHVVKMPVEYTQLLSAAHHIHNTAIAGKVYAMSHVNHPCTNWVAGSEGAYSYVLSLLDAVSKEYYHRYGRVHKSYSEQYERLSSFNPSPDVATPLQPLCMPDQYKVEGDVVQSYRNYYLGDKRLLAGWAKRNDPEWWK